METKDRVGRGSGSPASTGHRFFRSEVLGWEDPAREGAERAEAMHGGREAALRARRVEGSGPSGGPRGAGPRVRTGSIASQP